MSRVLLLISLWLCTGPVLAGQPVQHLAYVVSYQGLLSAGLPVDMAGIRLETASGQARLSVSTRRFRVAELILPVRFCYRADWASNGGLRGADWWSRIGSKASRGHLQADTARQQVIRRHTELKLEGAAPTRGEKVLFADAADPTSPALDQDLDQVPFTTHGVPMEQLSMLQWLRDQPLRTGLVFQPAVTNGRHLTGYRIEVEGEDEIDVDGRPTPCHRVRLEPRYDDDTDSYPTWVWIGRNARHLPLRFRGERAFGRFEARLLPPQRTAAPECHIPEAEGLALPTAG